MKQTLLHTFHIQAATITIRSGEAHPFIGQYDGKRSGFTIFESDLKRLRKKMARCLRELRV